MANNYFDFDIDGLTKNDGSPMYYENDEAIKNAFSYWLSSKKGDFLKNPNAGGVLDKFLFKNMSADKLEIIGFDLQTEISFGWSGIIALNNITIIPDYTNRTVDIEVSYRIVGTNKTDTVVLYLDKGVDQLNVGYQEITYIEENLYNFVSIQKNSYKNEKLLYNTDMSSWVWGKFKLVNLTEADSYFDDILAIINLT